MITSMNDVLLSQVLRPFLSNLVISNFFSSIQESWYMFVVKNNEKEEFLNSKFVHTFVILYFAERWYWRSSYVMKEEQIQLNEEYTLIYFYLPEYEDEFKELTSEKKIHALKTVFQDEKYKQYKEVVLDLFWNYWIYTILKQMLFVFELKNVFWTSSYKNKSLWRYWKWDITIDLKKLQYVIDQWKEEFQRKVDLLLEKIVKFMNHIYQYEDSFEFSVFYRLFNFPKLRELAEKWEHYVKKHNIDFNEYKDYKFKFYSFEYINKAITIIKDFLFEKYIKTEKTPFIVWDDMKAKYNIDDHIFYLQTYLPIIDQLMYKAKKEE